MGYGYVDVEKGDFLMANAGVGIPIDVKLQLMRSFPARAFRSVERTTSLISTVSTHPRGCNLLALIATRRTRRAQK